jgi:hypothetical protein
MSWTLWRDRIRSALQLRTQQAQPEVTELDALRGARARALLEDELAQYFFAAQEQQLIDRMVALPLEDDQSRQRLAIAIQTIRQLREYLISTAQRGQAAAQELQRLEKGRARAPWSSVA